VKVRLLSAAVTIGLASVAWTTSAAADNPHGTPPGQQNASASATVNASTHTNASAHANGKAHAKASVAVQAKGHAKVSGQAHGAVKTQAQPTVSAGVAPSSATTANKPTFAAATSNKTKLYGNGETAGQIAIQAGFGGSTLYGPGNSQPHKTSCGVHSIDVHALKAHAGTCGTTTTTSVAARVHGHAHGHVGLGVLAHVSATLVTALGMKPASFTSKNTLEAATSNKTKLYGNGTTAGQIAIQAGFGSAMLFGPGNSQPHKTACGAHMIDVHALKAHGGAAACATPSVSTSETSSVSPAQANVAASAAAQAAAANSQAAAGNSQGAGNSGVLSAKASAPAKTNKHASGVLSAKAALAATAKKPLRLVATVRHGNLPFTGLALWMPMALGLGLIATGLAMRRKGDSLI